MELNYYQNLINKKVEIKEDWYKRKGWDIKNYNYEGIIQNIYIRIEKKNSIIFYEIEKSDGTMLLYDENDVTIL